MTPDLRRYVAQAVRFVLGCTAVGAALGVLVGYVTGGEVEAE